MALQSSNAARDLDAEFRDVWNRIEDNAELSRKALTELATHQIECKNNYVWIQFYLKTIMGLLGFALLLEVLGGPGALRFLLHKIFGA